MDTTSRNALIESHLPLARQLAWRYARGPESIDDLIQVASVGLVKAANRFDPSLGYAFSSFAVPTVVGEIKRYFRDTAWAVHLPRGLQECSQRVAARIASLTDELGRAPSSAEVAESLELSVDEVIDARQALAAFEATSLDVVVAGDEQHGHVKMGDVFGAVDEGYALAEARAALEPALAGLPARERVALWLRYHSELSQREIGELIGVSQMHVCRILRASLGKLRVALEA